MATCRRFPLDVEPFSTPTGLWNVLAILGASWASLSGIYGIVLLAAGTSTSTSISALLYGGVTYSVQFITSRLASLGCAIFVMIRTKKLIEQAREDNEPWEWWIALTGASILHIATGFFGLSVSWELVSVISVLWLIPMVICRMRFSGRRELVPVAPTIPLYRPGMIPPMGGPFASGMHPDPRALPQSGRPMPHPPKTQSDQVYPIRYDGSK